ncbi:MAG TPA: flagellar biosynthetic protein FliR [Parachlamydiaceae bacterium]|nr:flagellar biosynthetic protein FliR [Parachlamydiaceae bacterium]
METPDGSYLYIFLTSAFNAENPLAVLSLLFLFLARMLPIIALSPFFGARVLPHPVKMTLAISMFVIFLPQLLTVTTTQIGFSPYTVLLLTKELFVGMLLGLVISMPFSIAQNVGIIIDHQRGGASLMVNDPTIQNQSSPLGTLFNMVLIFLFYMIDGPFIFLNAIITSYDMVPPDQFINPRFFEKTSTFWPVLLGLFNKAMVLSMQLASPALLAILMTDVFLGVANRLAPQVQITFLGMPLKSLLALTVVCFGWRLFSEEMVRQVYGWLDVVNATIVSLSGK